MADHLIVTKVSVKELTFNPGNSPTIFEVDAINYSDQFASFQLEVIAAGAESNANPSWYILSPEICTKKPPGDSTRFQVQIVDTPVAGFVGQMNLTVRVFSIELQDENRQLLRLIVKEAKSGAALKLKLPVKEFQVYPDQQVKIPVQIFNPGQQAVNTMLQLSGIESGWLIEEQQSFHLPAGDRIETVFLCQIPEHTQAISQLYPFAIEANQTNGLSARVEGSLLVLPKGTVEFRCNPEEHRIPAQNKFSFRSNPVTYQLEFQNHSNLHQTCRINLESEAKLNYEIVPEQVDIKSGETNQMLLTTQVKRHWIGGVKNFLIEVTTELADERLGNTEPNTQVLQLKVLPLIPKWLLVSSGLFLLWLLWWCSWLNPDNPFFGHNKAVNSVQFNGLASNVISGSNDQTSILWLEKGFFNPLINQYLGRIGNSGKAVRVVRYRPVDNNVMAAGLENGEIQLWDLTGTRGFIDAFSYQKDDRVFALEFMPDSRSLFSAHGSGLVLHWDISFSRQTNPTRTERVLRKKQFDFAIYDIKLLGQARNYLAVAGRYNQLSIWNLATDQILKVPYTPGGQDDYIFSLSTAETVPYILATADNQGYITVWDMEKCIKGEGDCEIRDRWLNSQQGQAVRSLSLSYNACYLASGGDDGKVRLWALTSDGKRAREIGTSEEVKKEVIRSNNGKKINSVDIKLIQDNVLIASGSDDTQVRVQKEKRRTDLDCDYRNYKIKAEP